MQSGGEAAFLLKLLADGDTEAAQRFLLERGAALFSSGGSRLALACGEALPKLFSFQAADFRGLSRGAISLAEAALRCRFFRVRAAAADSVGLLFARRDVSLPDVLPLITACKALFLCDSESSVREAAARALSALPCGMSGDLRAVAQNGSLRAKFGDFDFRVREAACTLVAACAPALSLARTHSVPADLLSLQESFSSSSAPASLPPTPFFDVVLAVLRGESPPAKRLLCSSACWNDAQRSAPESATVCLLATAWEAARECVAGRLKTSLGGPMQTFGALEKMLQDSGSTTPLLLAFFDFLEKFVTNACEPCPSGLPALTGPTAQFFSLNKKVCADWFVRLRLPRLQAAARCGAWAHVARIAPGTLPLLQGPLHDQWTLCLAKELAEDRDVDSLDALIASFRGKKQPLPRWLSAFAHLSAGRLEAASVVLEEAISQEQDTFIRDELWESFATTEACLGDWSRLAKLAEGSKDANAAQAISSAFQGDLRAVDAASVGSSSGAISSVLQLLQSISGSQRDVNDRIRFPEVSLPLSERAEFNFANDCFAHEVIAAFRRGESVLDKFEALFSIQKDAVSLCKAVELASLLEKIDPNLCHTSPRLLLRAAVSARKSENFSLAERLLARAQTSSSLRCVELEAHLLRVASGKLSPIRACDAVSSIFGMQKVPLETEALSFESLLRIPAEDDKEMFRARLALADLDSSNYEHHLMQAIKFQPSSPRGWLRLGRFLYEKAASQVAEVLSCGKIDFSNTEISSLQRFSASQESTPELLSSVSDALVDDIERCESLDFGDFQNKLLSALESIEARDSTSSLNDLYKACIEIEGRHLAVQRSAALCLFRALQLRTKHSPAGTDASLKLLRLFSRFGHLLVGQVLSVESMAKTHASCWRLFVPNIFSLLQHPNAEIASVFEEVACRMSSDVPGAVVFPAVVGLERGTAQGKAALARILERVDPPYLGAVRLVIAELHRIAVLWEERWIDALQRTGIAFYSALKGLKEDLAAIPRDDSREHAAELIHRKTVKPMLDSLERLFEETSRPSETPHESNFQALFSPAIRHALKTFSEGCSDDPEFAWMSFKDLLKQMAQRYKPRVEKLLDLSTLLKSFCASKYASLHLPGCIPEETGVTIEAFADEVSVIATKTKPKKITVVGSNGALFSYLLKGTEDLRLDERVMQFFSAFNELLPAEARDLGLRARTFSVTPIGKTVGIVRWVDSAVPLFTVYRDWQRSCSNPVSERLALRPAEAFYSKIVPALSKQKISLASRRDCWPRSLLLSVFHELETDTPKRLLAQWLWFNSATVEHWKRKETFFGQSLAAMSMLGSTLGLGDRHLDNILLDSRTGEVIHIDYSVSFEKGQLLRIPERVPFRLTQNLVEALGFCGVDGSFRRSCERVLTALRQNADSLVALLDSLILDPLDFDAPIGNTQGSACEEFLSKKDNLLSATTWIEATLTGELESLCSSARSCVLSTKDAADAKKVEEDTISSLEEIEQQARLFAASSSALGSRIASLKSERQTLATQLHEVRVNATRARDACLRHSASHSRVLEALCGADIRGIQYQLQQAAEDGLAAELIEGDACRCCSGCKGAFVGKLRAFADALLHFVECLEEYRKDLCAEKEEAPQSFLCAHWAEALRSVASPEEEGRSLAETKVAVLRSEEEMRSCSRDSRRALSHAAAAQLLESRQKCAAIFADVSALPSSCPERSRVLHQELSEQFKVLNATASEVSALEDCAVASLENPMREPSFALLENAMQLSERIARIDREIAEIEREGKALAEKSESSSAAFDLVQKRKNELHSRAVELAAQLDKSRESVVVAGKRFLDAFSVQRIQTEIGLLVSSFAKLAGSGFIAECSTIRVDALLGKAVSSSKQLETSLSSLATIFSGKHAASIEKIEAMAKEAFSALKTLSSCAPALVRLVEKTKQARAPLAQQQQQQLQEEEGEYEDEFCSGVEESDEDDDDEDEIALDRGSQQKRKRGPHNKRQPAIQAHHVLRRIHMKLHSDQLVSEQVSQSIAQATDPENLSQMYEGWAAWI